MSAAVRPAPPVTNSRIASALLALASAEAPGSRPSAEYRAAAWTLRQLPEDLWGRRVRIAGLPDVSPRAADAIGAFLACSSDETVSDRLARMLEREDPTADLKSDFLSRADVDRILSSPPAGEGEAPAGMADLSGDLHLHTDRSDGKMPLDSLHRALAARGDRFAFLTDHARDCAVAGGLFAADFEAERREVDRLNERTEGSFRMLLGAEANIAEDGTIDVTPARVGVLEAVVASVHTDLRSPRDQAPRLVRAIETPGVAVLGHPRGRLYALRSGIRADWPRVFEVAARLGVAVELNGCPERLDLDPRLAALASEAGCLFTIASDAHAHRHLDFVRYGLAVARMAGIPASRIVNTWSAERVADWLRSHRSR
ncbi:MAG: PHP domain-containing protein [Acidobacteria bacterium]|nr:MAG: PHP domain-containing protein [Acidobacteriota bacterium]